MPELALLQLLGGSHNGDRVAALPTTTEVLMPEGDRYFRRTLELSGREVTMDVLTLPNISDEEALDLLMGEKRKTYLGAGTTAALFFLLLFSVAPSPF